MVPPVPATKRSRPQKEERSDRRDRYDRIERLTQDLSAEIRFELARRKELWDLEGNGQEEEFWESRKLEVYKGLEKLAGEIQRAFRDRQKEAVMEMWSKESEELKASPINKSPWTDQRGRQGSRGDGG